MVSPRSTPDLKRSETGPPATCWRKFTRRMGQRQPISAVSWEFRTELRYAAFPSAAIVGIDNSAEMIEAARKRMPAVLFEIETSPHGTAPGPYDVILANAALQWVPDQRNGPPETGGETRAGREPGCPDPRQSG